MKSVFLYSPDVDHFDVIRRAADDVLDVLDALKEGRSLSEAKRRFEYEEGDRQGEFPMLDLLIPVLSEKAFKILRPLIEPWTRAQELKADGRTFFAMAVPHMVDCLDRDKTKVSLSYGLTAEIDQIYLRPERLDESSMFCIKGVEHSGIFVSGEFMQVVSDHKLRGLEKVKVWPKD